MDYIGAFLNLELNKIQETRTLMKSQCEHQGDELVIEYFKNSVTRFCSECGTPLKEEKIFIERYPDLYDLMGDDERLWTDTIDIPKNWMILMSNLDTGTLRNNPVQLISASIIEECKRQFIRAFDEIIKDLENDKRVKSVDLVFGVVERFK